MRKYFFRVFSGLVIALLFVPFNPWISPKGNNVFALTIEEERKLGEEVVREVEGKFSLIRDPLLLDYLNKLGREVLKQAGSLPYPFRFYLLKDPQLNAFSIPGGHIFLTTGIIEIMDSEGELAGLLGHEIAHVTRHHISSQIEKQKKIGLATMATALLGILAGDPSIAGAAIVGSLATAQTLMLKYSRENEDDADNYGFKYMSGVGFDPKTMIDLLDKLRRWGSFGSEGVPAYMQTHPLSGDRMSHIEDLLHRYADQGPWKRSSSDEFRRLQTIILANYGDLQRARIRFQSWSKDTPSQFWVFYGQGWLDLREGKFDSAITQFEKAASLKPQDLYLLRDLGQVFMKKGDYEKAIQKLSQASLLDPKDSTTAFLLGRAYQEKKENLLALENFQKALNLGSEEEDLHYYLGMTYGNLNNLGQAHYHFGKSFGKKGDREKALFHFKTALRYVDQDPGQKARIEKEIKNLESEKIRGKKTD
ncbi:MAG: M48 family metalloprotease [Deltaproteobacteria bacterium]|nr:M48 family metalloprotease [Deltaproteobacteria bacterium]